MGGEGGFEHGPSYPRYVAAHRLVRRSSSPRSRDSERRSALLGGRFVAIVVVAVIVVGCRYIDANASPSPELQSPLPSLVTSANPSSAPSEAAPTESIEPSTDPPATTPEATTTGTPNGPTLQPTPKGDPPSLPSPEHVGGLAASDRFWETWYETCWFGAFSIVSSLEEITSQSDLVIRGTISDLYIRRPWDDFQPAYAKVSISEILKGEPASEEPGTAEVQIGFIRSDLAELRSSLPAHGHLWFLTQYENGAATYHPTDYPQVGILRDIGGVVEVIMPEAIASAYSRRHFPVPLNGTSFEELVARVRQLAGESAAVHAFSRSSPSGEGGPNRFDAC